jgi:[NiFe] hydrogenase diaphorase moiety small subunit
MNKVKWTLNGKEVEFQEGANLAQAIKSLGNPLPTICWDPGIEPSLGTCRVCSVKIDGRIGTSCTTEVRKGMVVESDTVEVKDLQKGVTELLFVEGNHYCPSCEKSGDCQLQGVGYDLGMTHSRFPYKFETYELDYSGNRLILERNRCVHCKRCTDLFVDDKGRKVFSFLGKGAETRVMMDHDLEKEMSEHKRTEAVELCPVGAIILKGRGFHRPIGERDSDHKHSEETHEGSKV